MFNRKLFGLLTSLYLARATSPDMCSSACGSAANSFNPYSDMGKLLQSGANCPTTYSPLTMQSSQYGYGNAGNSTGGEQQPCIPSYYPQQQTGQGGYSQTGYPSMGTPSPFTGANNNMGKDEECEVTTSIECKPKRNGQGGYSQTGYPSMGTPSPYGWNSAMTNAGSSTTRPYPGSNAGQGCDCSQFTGGMSNNFSYPPSTPSFGGNTEGGCDCSQFMGQGGNSGQQQVGGGMMQTSPTGGFFGQKPIYCGPNGSNGGNGQQQIGGGMGMMQTSPTGRSGSVFDVFDCSKNYQSPPIKTAVIGVNELPISDNLRVTSSSCGPAPCL